MTITLFVIMITAVEPSTPSGPAKLKDFLERNKVSKAEAGRALGVTAAAVFGWIDGNVPIEDHRRAIEVWTHGEVKADEWGLTRREQQAQAKSVEVKPFEPEAEPEAPPDSDAHATDKASGDAA